MFGRRHKKPLFGAHIEPDCRYCSHNVGKEGSDPVCALRLTPKNGVCKKYEYDPLRREPKSGPSLQTDRYSEEDFKL